MTRFEEIHQIEPRIKFLFDSIPTKVKDSRDFWHTWSAIKRELVMLVGWNAQDPRLTSSSDYDVVYQTLFDHAERSLGNHLRERGIAK